MKIYLYTQRKEPVYAGWADSLNDADMLEAAGRGFAMQNADPRVKANADAIVESNNDAGVGKEILRLLREE